MNTEHRSPLSRFKWHVSLIALVVIPIVAFSVFGDGSADATAISPMLLFGGGSVLLVAILYVLVRLSSIVAAVQNNGIQLDEVTERLNRISDELIEIGQCTRLSESAKAIAFRDTERASLQEAVSSKLRQQDFDAAYELIDEIGERREYRDLAETLRAHARQLQGTARDDRIRQYTRQIEDLLAAHQWSKASVQIEGLIHAFPASDSARSLRHRLFVEKERQKKALLSAWDDSVKNQDTDRGLHILKELDIYLTPNEALALQEAAKDIFKNKLHNLGVHFSLAVSDRNWDVALEVGEEIIEGFPNSRMSDEIRGKLEVLRQNVAMHT